MIDLTQLVADYAAGASLRTLAKRYPYSHTRIAAILEAASIPRRRTWSVLRICSVCGCSFRPKHVGQQRCSDTCKPGPHAPTCKRGHPLTPENLTPRYGGSGSRCRVCLYARQAEYAARKKT